MKTLLAAFALVFAVSAPAAACPDEGGDEYNDTVRPVFAHDVVAGQTLYGLARTYYGDGSQWPTIAEVNEVTPSTLRAGSRVWIPNLRDLETKPSYVWPEW